MIKIRKMIPVNVWAGVVFLAFLAIGSCRQKQERTMAHDAPIRIGLLNGPSAMSMVGLMESGCPGAGCEFIIRNEPDQIRAMMHRGELDIAFLPITMASLTYNRGFKYQLLGVSGWGALYLIGKNLGIGQIADLKGKTVHMMGRGMTPDLLFRYLLSIAGLEPGKDIELNYSFPSHVELANIVRAGRAELGVLSEPMASMVMAQNPELVQVLDLQAAWDSLQEQRISMPQTAVMINKTFAENNRDAVSDLEKAMSDAIEWVRANPEESGKLIVKYGILPDEAVAALSVPRCNFAYQSAAEVKATLIDFYSLMAGLNPDSIGGSLPDDDFFYTR